MKLEVSAADFMRCNSGLVRLLTVIEKSKKEGISTRQLCEQSFNSRNYGMRIIQKALSDKYIRRVKTGREVINLLTVKGRRLLKKLETK